MQRFLALDSCTEACSVALALGDQVLSRYEVAPREHAQKLLPFIEQILADGGISLTDLDAIAFTRGPGSFTGVRICAATAQGLAYGAGLPLIGVSTLQTMAQHACDEKGATEVVAAIDARMSEVYIAPYQRNAQGLMVAQQQEQVCAPDNWSFVAENSSSWQGVGTGWQTYADILMRPGITVTDATMLPHAAAMFADVRRQFADGQVLDAAEAQPVYLRDTVTWKKLPGRE